MLFHPDELLFVAIGQARAAAQAGYVPPARLQNVPVAGRNGIANFEMMLVNMREGGMISAHDYRVARSAAVALCGGEIETGTRVDEEWLLTVERRSSWRCCARRRPRPASATPWKPASLCGIEPPSAFGAPQARLRTGGAGSARPRSWGAVVGWESLGP